MFLNTRFRRFRENVTLRNMLQQVRLEPRQLIYPIFIAEDIVKPRAIPAMPGQKHWPVEQAYVPVKRAMKAGIKSFLLFGVPNTKDELGTSAYEGEPLICRAIKNIRKFCPDAYLITDVCLCAYTTHGHCGVLRDGVVANDETVRLLVKMVIEHVKAGVDMVAPSDMMDGRISAIRNALNDYCYDNIPIMSYAAKYASAYYGPFREAANSAPAHGDRKSYQMDYAKFTDEAMQELEHDSAEGADILMIKPGIAYLDILHAARMRFEWPLAIYQVSGEYSMIKAAAAKGWINEREVVLESLIAMRRAGADIIISYFAPEVAKWL